MTSMFKPPAPPTLPTPTAPEASRYKRMPVETDPDILAAGMRTRAEALRRTGRLSTILTDSTRSAAGAPYTQAKLG